MLAIPRYFASVRGVGKETAVFQTVALLMAVGQLDMNLVVP